MVVEVEVAVLLRGFRVLLQVEYQVGPFVIALRVVSEAFMTVISSEGSSGPGAWDSHDVLVCQLCAEKAAWRNARPRWYVVPSEGVYGRHGKYCVEVTTRGDSSVRFNSAKGT